MLKVFSLPYSRGEAVPGWCVKVIAKEKQARTDKHRVGNSRAVDKGKKSSLAKGGNGESSLQLFHSIPTDKWQ